MVEKLFPDSFLKNQNWEYLWINSLKFYAVCFYCISSWGLHILKLSCRPPTFTSFKAFLKNKKRSGTSLPVTLYYFWRKIFSFLYSCTWPNFVVWLPLLHEILGDICIAIVCYPGCDVMNFEINLIFLIKQFFLHDQKVTTKIKISWERKTMRVRL